MLNLYLQIFSLVFIFMITPLHLKSGEVENFKSGDLVLSTGKEIRLFRDDTETATLTPALMGKDPFCIRACPDGTLWLATKKDSSVILLRYDTPVSKPEEQVSPELPGLVEIVKLLERDGTLYVLILVRQDFKIGSEILSAKNLSLLPFDIKSGSFNTLVTLQDQGGEPQLLIQDTKILEKLSHAKRRQSFWSGIWDACFIGDNLWVSGQTRLLAFSFGRIPPELRDIFSISDIKGNGRQKISVSFEKANFGNIRGICPFGEGLLLSVDTTPPGPLTIINTKNPGISRTLTHSIEKLPGGWGFWAVRKSGDNIFVSNNKVGKVYEIDASSGDVRRILVNGLKVREIDVIK